MFIPSGKLKTSIQIVTLDNDTFYKYAKKIGANYKKVKDKGILCDEYMYQEDNKLIYKRMYSYSKGDVITGKIDGKDFSIEVGFVSDIKPYGYERHYSQGGYLVLNNDEYKDLNSVPVNLAIQSSNPEELVKEIKKIDNDLRCTNFEESEKIVELAKGK